MQNLIRVYATNFWTRWFIIFSIGDAYVNKKELFIYSKVRVSIVGRKVKEFSTYWKVSPVWNPPPIVSCSCPIIKEPPPGMGPKEKPLSSVKVPFWYAAILFEVASIEVQTCVWKKQLLHLVQEHMNNRALRLWL